MPAPAASFRVHLRRCFLHLLIYYVLVVTVIVGSALGMMLRGLAVQHGSVSPDGDITVLR